MRYAVAVSDEPRPGDFLNKMNIYMSKEYKLVEAGNIGILENLINEKVNQGWTPHGELSVQQVLNSARYTQVMVREKKDINEVSDNGKQLLHG
jgi:hypothetical protein